MAKSIVEALLITIGIDKAGYEADIKSASSSLSAFKKKESDLESETAKKIAAERKKLRDQNDKDSKHQQDILKDLSSGYKTVAAAIATVSAALKLIGVVETQAQLGRLATNLSTSAKELDAWGKTIETVGGKKTEILSFFQSIQGGMNAYKNGDYNNSVVRMFSQMGIGFSDANGKLKTQKQLMDELAGKLQNYKDPQDQMRLIMGMGGGSQAVLDMLRLGNREMDTRYEHFKKISGVTDESVKKAQRYEAAWANLRATLDTTQQTVFMSLTPAIEKLNDLLLRFSAWVEKHQEGIGKFFGAIGTVIEGAATAMGKLDTATNGWSTAILGVVAAFAALRAVFAGILALSGLPLLLKLVTGGGGVRLPPAGGGGGPIMPLLMTAGAGFAGFKAGEWLNDNVVNPGVQKLTGDKNQTLGGWIYDKTHPRGGNTSSQKPTTPDDSLYQKIINSDLAHVMTRAEGRYNIANTNGGKGIKKFDPNSTTLGQIMNEQRAGTMFAVGKYQFIPGTLKARASELGMTGEELFNKDTQDRLFVQQLRTQSKAAYDYITGKAGSSLKAAMLSLSHSWASFAAPAGSRTRRGYISDGTTSYYAGNGVDRASVSQNQQVSMLNSLRQQIAGGGPNIHSETHIGTINIETKATDAGGIARDIKGSMNSAFRGNANYAAS